MSETAFEPGTLRERLRRASERALGSGAQQPITTRFELIEDAGIAFLVRIVDNLGRKAASLPGVTVGRRSAPPAAQGGPAAAANPFLPYEPDMFVADVSPSHVALLNKFNVLADHLLVVTRRFERQEDLLTLADFAALSACLDEIDGLGFYNAGRTAGASQPHKHLQLVPLPLVPGGAGLPFDALLAGAIGPALAPTAAGVVPGLPFRHALAPLDLAGRSPRDAEQTLACYRALLAATGLDHAAPPPYNLLVTRRWMLLVPRSRERFESISVNALGFAGALLVRDAPALARLRAAGPMSVLASVGCPRSGW